MTRAFSLNASRALPDFNRIVKNPVHFTVDSRANARLASPPAMCTHFGAMRLPSSARVVRVNMHVIRRQIGCPKTTLAPSDSEIDPDSKFAVLEIFVRSHLVEVCNTSTVDTDLLRAQPDCDSLRLDRCPRVACGGHQPAPVGVASRPRSLHQWGMSDSLGHLERIGVAGRAFDLQLDHMRHTLAIVDNLL